jgi:hypothetical protein
MVLVYLENEIANILRVIQDRISQPAAARVIESRTYSQVFRLSSTTVRASNRL